MKGTNTKINVKNDVYKNGHRRRSCTSKTAKIQRFVRFLMYCSITSTTLPVAFYYEHVVMIQYIKNLTKR